MVPWWGARFVNVNFTAFRKILKKHDKTLPNPCSAFYIGRLHQQGAAHGVRAWGHRGLRPKCDCGVAPLCAGWLRGDYSDIIVNISRIYSTLRGDKNKAAPAGASQNFLRKTTKVGGRRFFSG